MLYLIMVIFISKINRRPLVHMAHLDCYLLGLGCDDILCNLQSSDSESIKPRGEISGYLKCNLPFEIM